MKTLKTTFLSSMALVLLLSINAFATNADKVVEKARAMVSEAAPHDWQTLAKAADLCIKKDVNLTEAKEWLDKSLTIKESSMALEVAGDYYAKNKLYDQAINNYVQSMLKIKDHDRQADTSRLEAKIAKAKKNS
ncbi:MAG TPA: hypothetical protein PKL31_07785 [Fulvivirga sp.]|nr:hypothetical protein [Fulvivirga sp.]